MDHEDPQDFDASPVFDLAFERARRFIHDGYPGVEMDSDPLVWWSDCKSEAEQLATAEAVEAGHDPDDPEIKAGVEHAFDVADTATRVAYDGGGNSEQWSAHEAFHAPLRPAPCPKSCDRPATNASSGVRHRRASRPAPARRRGSRRVSAGSRAGPDDEGELPGDIAAPLPVGGRR